MTPPAGCPRCGYLVVPPGVCTQCFWCETAESSGRAAMAEAQLEAVKYQLERAGHTGNHRVCAICRAYDGIQHYERTRAIAYSEGEK